MWFRNESPPVIKVIYKGTVHNIGIFADDDVLTVKGKIVSGLFKDKHLNDLYLWCEHKVVSENKAIVVRNFLKNLFRERSFITTMEYKTAVSNCFNITGINNLQTYDNAVSYELASTSLMELNLQVFFEPVGFKYMVGQYFSYLLPVVPKDDVAAQNQNEVVNEDAKLISSFKVDKIFVVSRSDIKNADVYFPFSKSAHEKDFMEIIAKNHKIINAVVSMKLDAKKFQTVSYPSFIHVRVQEGGPDSQIDVMALFNQINPSSKVPLVKCINGKSTLYKLNKNALLNDMVSKKNLSMWTKPNKAGKYRRDQSLLVLKIYLDSKVGFATCIIFSTGTIDLKFTARSGDDKISYEEYISYLKKGVKIIKDLLQIELYESRIIKTIIMGTIMNKQKNEVNSLTALRENLSEYTPFFSVLNEGKVLHLIYKRIDNFNTSENIDNFINRNGPFLSETDLVKFVSSLFNISEAEAKEHYKSWHSLNKGKTYFKSKNLNHISVKISKYNLGFKFIIDGVTDPIQEQNIVLCLMNALDKKPAKQNKKENDDALLDIVFKSYHDDTEEGGEDVTEFNEDYNDEDIIDIIDVEETQSFGVLDIDEIKRSGKCPASMKGGADLRNKYVLEKLYEADSLLFNHPDQDKDTKYAKKCQAVSKRQPMVFSKVDVDYNNKCFPGGLGSTVNYGSDPEKHAKNFYACPQVWCPESRTALTLKQYKQLGNQCPFPDLNEKPIVFTDNHYWQKKNGEEPYTRYIAFLDPTDHPTSLCMPCCGKKPLTDDNNKCTNIQGNEKYILADHFPTVSKRFSLLPEQLSKLFENKFCGGKDGGIGLMNEKTDCYLKYGLSPSAQPFLQALDVTEEAFEKLVKNMTMLDFIYLNNGRTANEFMTMNINVTDNVLYEFKDWFSSSKAEDYRKAFNLQHLVSVVKLFATAGKEFPYENEVLREILTFSAYKAFKEYALNKEVIKTHDIFLDLINPQSFNVIVFEVDAAKKATLSCQTCSKITDKTKPFKLLIRFKHYYEPIVRVRFIENQFVKSKKGTFEYTWMHKYSSSTPVNPLVKFIMSSCTDGLSSFNTYLAQFSVQHIVLNYNRTVYGIYTKDHVLLPINDNINLSKVALETGVTFKYVDQVVREHTVKIDVELVKKYLKAIGIKTGVKLMREMNYMTVHDKYVIPLAKVNTVDLEFNDDVAIFLQKEEADVRKLYIDKTRNTDRLYKSFMNHLLERIDRSEITFLRHRQNPLPKAAKRAHIKSIIIKLADEFVHKYKYDESVEAVKHSNLCSTLKDKETCLAPCAWITRASNSKGVCKLKVSDRLLDRFIEKSVEDFLNPLFKLQSSKFGDQKKNADTLLFTDDETDIKSVLSQINNPHTYDYEHVEVPFVKPAADKVIEPIDLISSKVSKNVPTQLRSALPNMNVYIQEDPHGALNNLMQNLFGFKLSGDNQQTPEMVLKELQKGLPSSVNLIVIGTNTNVIGGRKCVTRNTQANSVIFLLQKDKAFHPVFSSAKEFVIAKESLEASWHDFIAKGCKAYTI